MKTLIIDNYDSFTYNIYQLVAQINSQKPIVITNDQLSWTKIKQGNFDNIIISPGPGNPETKKDFGVCGEVLLKADCPILGICLGHQGLGYFYGSEVIKAPEPFHGRVSHIYHRADSLFDQIPSPFRAVRYHSLVLKAVKNQELKIIATTDDDLIMAIKHRHKPFWGVQFHPESIRSQYGRQLLQNFNELTIQYYQNCSQGLPSRSAKNYDLCCNSSTPRSSLSNQLSPQQLQVFTRKLDIFPNSAVIFEQLYSKAKHSFWLDSSMVAQGLSRFSYMGDGAGKNSFLVTYQVKKKVITKIINDNKSEVFQGDIFDFLQSQINQYSYQSKDLPFNFNGGFVGYLGYELKSLCGYENKHLSNNFDAQFIFIDRLIVFDHLQKNIYLLCIARGTEYKTVHSWFEQMEKQLRSVNVQGNKNTQKDKKSKVGKRQNKYRLNRNKKEYLRNIKTSLEKIIAGESYEICLTNNLYLDKVIDPLEYYLKLRKSHPVPYGAYLKLAGVSIVSLSPERFLRLDKQGYLESKPIKGTVKRGDSESEDEYLKNQLQCSEKEQAENLMIVDLLRNDLGKICEIGSVNVPKLMTIESYSTVHQMVSTVRGKIKSGISNADCLKACFPGGSMTGAPKKRTIEIIDQLETEARGIYSGSIGFLALNGTMDFNIVIRTAIISAEETTIGVGGAITILSDPDSEFEEIILKAKALLLN